MKKLMLIPICWLTISVAGAQSTTSTVSIRLLHPQKITATVEAAVEMNVVELLKTSNFNSKDRPEKFPGGIKGVQQRYRDAVGGQYLLVVFTEPCHFDLIRGEAEAIEVIVGVNNPQYADALFTIDPEGRIVEHAKFSGQLATELRSLFGDQEKGG